MSDELQAAIEAFRPIAMREGWDTQEGAFQRCGDASEAFAGFVIGRGFDDVEEACFNGLPPEAKDAICRLGKPSLIDDEGTGHGVTRVGTTYVDWTARQFYPDKPFPTIWTLDELHEAGWR